MRTRHAQSFLEACATDRKRTLMSQDANMELDDDEPDESGNSALRKKLREAERKAKDSEDRALANEAAARRVAFLDAGIPKNPQTDYFQQTYSGDLTAEAIKTAAQAHGFLAAQEAETQAEIDVIEGMSFTAQGADTPERASSEEALDRELREAAEEAFKSGNPQDVGPALEAVLRRHGKDVAADYQ